MNVGYIRVSSVDQNTERQLDGVELDKVFEEKVSGRNMDRPQLTACLDYLREGDTLLVHSMDRLARNLKDLLNIVDGLVNKGVKVKFKTENLEFCSAADNPMGYLMLSMLGSVHQFHLALIKQNQMEGLRKAKERGQQLGRQPLAKKKIKEICNRRAKGQGAIEIALAMNLGTSTVYKYWKTEEEKQAA